MKLKPLVRSICIDKQKLDLLKQKIKSPNMSEDAKYAQIKKVAGGVCSVCEGIPTKMLVYDMRGVELLEKYCDKCLKKWVK